MQKKLLVDLFKNKKNGEGYIVFEHIDKTWILPRMQVIRGLDMYQPSTIKGKILKKCVVLFKDIPIIASKIGLDSIDSSLNNDILACIKDITGQDEFYIAAYMGDTTTRQNNKATLQIYDEEKIIAYAKITNDAEVKSTFQKEIEFLKFLKKKHIENIPRIIGERKINEINLFVQSTRKGFNEKVKLIMGRKQIEFIRNIAEKTQVRLIYEETDFYKDVEYLKSRVNEFFERDILISALDYIEDKLKETSFEYSFFHGDFTPWNVYYVNGNMEVFDFEYSSYSMPCYMDIFHYLTQLSLLGKKNGVGGTVYLYKKYRKLLEEYICNPDFVYICYLVYIISFYKQRTEESVDISEKYEQWIGILDYLLGKMKNKKGK